MRHHLSVFVVVALCACSSRDQGDDAPPDNLDAPQGPVDAPTGTCASIAGTWGIAGDCGADTCVITQTGCSTQLSCGGGSSSYTGSITGDQFMYTGTTGSGVPASCSGTVDGNTLSGSCTVAGVPCTFNGQRL